MHFIPFIFPKTNTHQNLFVQVHGCVCYRCCLPNLRNWLRFGIWRIPVFAFCIYIAVTGASYAANGTGLHETPLYGTNEAPGLLENLNALLQNLILPNVPGALMLLILSSLFSSINFYTAVKSKRRPFRVMARYLSVWIFLNYLFALLVLLLILPSDQSLSTINKTLFVYCLVATAMPEVAANLRLQLGNSANALDLYKYKSRVSDLITERLGHSVAEQRMKDLMALAFFYYGRLDLFLEKLAIFRNQENLSNEEISDIEAFAEKLKERPVAGRQTRVIELEREHSKIVPKLIHFFRDDIRTFSMSPVADLMDKLHPLLRIDEARKLVETGVTTPGGFLRRNRFKSTRKRMASSTGIGEGRLSRLYYSTRVTKKKQLKLRMRWLGATAAVCALVIGAMYWIKIRSLTVYSPDNISRSEIVVHKLNPDSSNPNDNPGNTMPTNEPLPPEGRE